MISYIMGFFQSFKLRNRYFHIFLVLLFILALSEPINGKAQNGIQLSLDVFAGFDSVYKEGEWTPIRIVLGNNGQGVEGEVLVQFKDSGNILSPVSIEVQLPSVSRKELTVYVYPANTFATRLSVSFKDDRTVLIEKEITLKRLGKSDDLYGIIATTPSAFNILSTLDPPNGSANVVELSIGDLPDRAQGYGALDTLVFSGVDTGALSERQLDALSAWTTQGGRLILTGGADWENTLYGFRDAGLLPLESVRSNTLNHSATQDVINQVLSFSGSQDTLQAPNNLILANGDVKPKAETVLQVDQDQSTKLVLRQSYGSGEVVFITFDPSQPPFRGWAGIEDFYQLLFMNSLSEPSWQHGFIDWNMAQQAAQTMPSLGLPSIMLICGFLSFYIVILGPVNFLLLRLIKRRELGWVTIPGFVVLFSFFVFLGGSLSRGQKPVLNRLAIVQGWSGSDYARVDGLLGIYSPNRAAYDVVSEYPTLLHAIPNSSFFQSETITLKETVETVTIPDVNVDIGGVYPLAYQSSAPPPTISQELTLAIGDNGVLLEGTIINESSLSLENAVLLTPSSIIDLGNITPNETITVNEPIGIPDTGITGSGPSSLRPISGVVVPQPYSSTQGNVLEEILGTYDYYSNREVYRKYALLVSAMSYSPTFLNQKNEVYLIGWSNNPVTKISLAEQSTNSDDLTLYILGYNPRVEFRGERWTLDPGFYQWSPLDSNRTDISPYNQYLYSKTSYGLVFTPRQNFQFSKIESLIFHIKSPYQSGEITGVEFELWDYQANEWKALGEMSWGDFTIPNPESFVANEFGSDELGNFSPGTIRLQVKSTAEYLQIESSDFTLIVNR